MVMDGEKKKRLPLVSQLMLRPVGIHQLRQKVETVEINGCGSIGDPSDPLDSLDPLGCVMGIHWIILDPLIIGRGVDIDFDIWMFKWCDF